MPNRPRFSLKAMLVIIAVLSVPLAMIATWYPTLSVIGYYLLFAVGGGSLGYLLGGRRHTIHGLGIGLFLGLVLPHVIWGILGLFSV